MDTIFLWNFISNGHSSFLKKMFSIFFLIISYYVGKLDVRPEE